MISASRPAAGVPGWMLEPALPAPKPCLITAAAEVPSLRYSAELKERAVRMVAEAVEDGETEWVAMRRRIAELLGVGSTEPIRKWVRQQV